MADIVLTTFNARYEHASLGLRCLAANLGALAGRAKIIEFNLETGIPEALEAVLAENPRVVGLGVYVWNAREALEFAGELKALRPEIVLVAGGPEISFETEKQELGRLADYVIAGEGEQAFAGLCAALLAGRAPARGLIKAEAPDLAALELPYGLYSDEDLELRLLYAEASRGCPYGCEFCLSSLDKAVRYFTPERLFAAWDALLARGALRFKFTDRTFNLDIARAAAVLEFFLARLRPGLFLHFELVPDRLPEALLELIKKFPAGSLQLEVGLQTFDPEVAARISRRQDGAAAERNIARLLKETGAYIHADLVAGLPGEGLAGFAAGFDRLYALGPQEIQVGLLKRLRGAPIARHDGDWGMVYSPFAPYELRQSKALAFAEVRRLRRFARYWDLVANSGVFAETARLICAGPSPFAAFMVFSDRLYAATGQTHSISRARLREFISVFLAAEKRLPAAEAGAAAERDALRACRSNRGAKRQARRAGTAALPPAG